MAKTNYQTIEYNKGFSGETLTRVQKIRKTTAFRNKENDEDTMSNMGKLVSAIFITFSGNCRKALTFYQSCFGGILQFEFFEKELQGYTEMPVVNGSLVSDSIIIHGSDLVYNEGRTLGNYISIFIYCKNTYDRKELIEKLISNKKDRFIKNDDGQKLVEVTDAFDVRWILGV